MTSYFEQLQTVIYALWRKRWHGLVAMWVICVCGWIAVALIPDRYQSKARIYVDTNTVLSEVLGGKQRNNSTNALRQVMAMRRTLISRPNLEKVIRRVDLDLTVETDADMDVLIKKLEENIRISSEGEDLFWFSYESGDPKFSDSENAELAKRIVQNLIAIFLDSDTKKGRSEIDNVQIFLEEQIADYERQLQEAERRRAEFERENLGLLPGERNYLERTQQARLALSDTIDSINELNLRRQELQRQLASVSPVVTTTGSVGGVPVGGFRAQQLQALQTQLEQNYARGFTDRHPDVVNIQRRIDIMSAQLESGEGANTASELVQGTPNPIYNDIRLQIIQTETQIASLNGRREKLQAQIASLRAAAQDAPLVEAEMTKLNRDYDILRKKYDELISNREEAKQIREINNKADKITFRIIDPPELPLTPVAPNRQLLLSMVLAVGLAAGAGVAFIFSQLQSSFATAQQLRDTFALPVIGSITTVLSDQQRSQKRLEAWAFSVLFFAVFLTYGTVMAWEVMQMLGANPIA